MKEFPFYCTDTGLAALGGGFIVLITFASNSLKNSFWKVNNSALEFISVTTALFFLNTSVSESATTATASSSATVQELPLLLVPVLPPLLE